MGWAGGTDVMCGIIEAAKTYFCNTPRQVFYREAIKVLRQADWDCENECFGLDRDWDDAFMAHVADHVKEYDDETLSELAKDYKKRWGVEPPPVRIQPS
jgi:hypothetical protein